MNPNSENLRAPSGSTYAMSSISESSIDPEYAEEHDRRILIVDDDEFVLKLFASYLNETYSCEMARNAQ